MAPLIELAGLRHFEHLLRWEESISRKSSSPFPFLKVKGARGSLEQGRGMHNGCDARNYHGTLYEVLHRSGGSLNWCHADPHSFKNEYDEGEGVCINVSERKERCIV